MSWLNYIEFLSLKTSLVIADGVDPDEMMQSEGSYLGLHCLSTYQFNCLLMFIYVLTNNTNKNCSKQNSVNSVLSSHSKIDKTKDLNDNGSLMKVSAE